MGLGFSCGPGNDDHCFAQWSYSGFGDFRIKVATEIGIELLDMAGYEPSKYMREIEEANKDIENREDQIRMDRSILSDLPEGKSWDGIDDPIVPFLRHSDSEGFLTPEECAKIAPRLKELIADWPLAIELKFPDEWQKIGYPAWKQWVEHNKKNGDLLVAGMEWATENNYPLNFN